MRLFSIFFNNLLPQTCNCCDSMLDASSSMAICDHCYYALPWLKNACTICALPLAEQASHVCGQCIKDPPAFLSAKIPFRYDYPLNQMIVSFKFQQKLSRGKTLSQLLIDFLRDEYKDQQLPDGIIPVPMYWKRQLMRGFNQSEQLANDIARYFSIPLLKKVCTRKHHRQPQKGSDKITRKYNLQNVFSMSNKSHLIHGKHLAVVDDVVTTGSTAREISNALIKQGAASVVIWAVARTPQPNST